MIKEYFINNLSKIENDWKRLEIGTEMTSFQTYDWSLPAPQGHKEKTSQIHILETSVCLPFEQWRRS